MMMQRTNGCSGQGNWSRFWPESFSLSRPTIWSRFFVDDSPASVSWNKSLYWSEWSDMTSISHSANWRSGT